MAALEVVQQRLSQIGLEPFCLELHSKKVTKRHFLQQMEKALEVRHRAITAGYKTASAKLLDERKNILGYVEAMHAKESTGFSLHDVISGYTSLPEPKMIALAADAIGHITPEILETATERLRNLDRSVFRITGNPCGHPLSDLWVRDNFDIAENDLKELLPKALEECSHRKNLAEEFMTVFGIRPLPYHIDQTVLKRFATLLGDLPMITHELCECTSNPQIFAVFSEAVEAGRRAQEIRGKLTADYSMEVMQLNPRDLRNEWDGIKTKWFLPAFSPTGNS